jgi:hypothetical protein
MRTSWPSRSRQGSRARRPRPVVSQKIPTERPSIQPTWVKNSIRACNSPPPRPPPPLSRIFDIKFPASPIFVRPSCQSSLRFWSFPIGPPYLWAITRAWMASAREALENPGAMTEGKKKGICFPLRLPLTMRAELQAQANNEGISINQFIVMAVAEKIIRIDMQQSVDGNCDPSEQHSELKRS